MAMRSLRIDRRTLPAAGFQHFGEVEVAPDGLLRVTLRGQGGEELWSTTVPAVA